MPKLDSDLVRHALSVARQHGFGEVEVGIGEERFSARLESAPKRQSHAKSQSGTPKEPDLQTITATLVGYYREAPVPLEVGARVRAGEVVAVISALGIANDVESKVAGEVVEVMVEPNQPVEYGQVLAKVKP